MSNLSDNENKKKYLQNEPKLILEEDISKISNINSPELLMEKQLDTYEIFNNNSNRRFDSVDKFNRSIVLGENNKLKNKTLWEIYDIGCNEDIDFKSKDSIVNCNDEKKCMKNSQALFDDYEIRRYPKPNTNEYGNWIGVEMNSTDYSYENDGKNPELLGVNNNINEEIMGNENDIRMQDEI